MSLFPFKSDRHQYFTYKSSPQNEGVTKRAKGAGKDLETNSKDLAELLLASKAYEAGEGSDKLVTELAHRVVHHELSTEKLQEIFDFFLVVDDGPILEHLLECGADVNAQEVGEEGFFSEERSPLHITIREGEEEAAITLIEHGAAVDWRDSEGFTPLHAAARAGKPKVIEALLQAGANPHDRVHVYEDDGDGSTPLHLLIDDWSYLVDEVGTENMMQALGILLEYGANVEEGERGTTGGSAIQAAATKGLVDALVLMVRKVNSSFETIENANGEEVFSLSGYEFSVEESECLRQVQAMVQRKKA